MVSLKRDINVKSEIGVMLPSSFDGMDSDEFTSWPDSTWAT